MLFGSVAVVITVFLSELTYVCETIPSTFSLACVN